MPASPDTVEQLARDTTRTTEPETALRALVALRQELDQIEPELVARALQTGASWSHIAQALGISKQAAHRKHRHLIDQIQSSPPAGGPKILVTSEARRAMQLAREEAHSLGQDTLGTEHILLGILRCQKGHAVTALNTLGITYEAVKVCLQPTMPGLPTNPQAPPPPDNTVSPHARRVLEGSLREAVKRHEGYIGVEHLLLAILADSRNGAVQTLEALKTTPAKIRRQLDYESQAASTTGPNAITPTPS